MVLKPKLNFTCFSKQVNGNKAEASKNNPDSSKKKKDKQLEYNKYYFEISVELVQ